MMIYLYIIWTVQNLYCFLGGGKDIYVAPFVDVKAFWEEYCQYNVAQYTPVAEVAGISTFRRAFKKIAQSILARFAITRRICFGIAVR